MTALRSPFAPGFTPVAADDLAAMLRVLADPTRLRILALLDYGPMVNKELEAHLPLKQPTISHHLRILTEAGLITSKRSGHFVNRALVPGRLRHLSHLLDPGGAA